MTTYFTENLSNGNAINYKRLDNGHCYHAVTPDKVVNVLENAANNRQRIKIYFGDIETGKDWNEENDTIGTIGFSTGRNKIPLLVKSSRSMGGGAILDNCIVKIKDSKTGIVLYQSENYNTAKIEIVASDMEGYTHNINIAGKLYSRHRSEKSAKMLLSKLS